MKYSLKSLGYAFEGCTDVWKHEKNLRRFILAHALVLAILSLWVDPFSLIILTCFAVFFIIVELLNTAIERLADTFDDRLKVEKKGHYHPGVKMTKDIGAAASLCALLLYIGIFFLITVPYFIFLLTEGHL
jgi:diacylglycerol kinase